MAAHRRSRTAVRSLAGLVVLVLMVGCADEPSLRNQQAKRLRRLCQATSGDVPHAPTPADLSGRLDLRRFRVGTPEGPERGIEVVGQCP